MKDANIVIGTYGTSAKSSDDYGVIGNHYPDTTNNIIGFNATQVSGTTSFEFTFPLASSDTSGQDVKLDVKSHAFFLFSLGASDDLTQEHVDGAAGATGVENVYIQSSELESYVTPAGAPFGEPILIIGALIFGAIFLKKKKMNDN